MFTLDLSRAPDPGPGPRFSQCPADDHCFKGVFQKAFHKLISKWLVCY